MGRAYSDGERYRFLVSIEQTSEAKGPGVAAARNTTTLTATLNERVTVADRETTVALTVVEAEATGDRADSERQSALGRAVTVTVTEGGFDFDFEGDSLGASGEIHAVDLALLFHLMSPVKPSDDSGGKQRRTDGASIPVGWGTRSLALEGTSATTSSGDKLDASSSFEAPAELALEIAENPEDVADGKAPAIPLYFTELFRSGGVPESPIFLAPVVLVDLFSFTLGCAFTLGLLPECGGVEKETAHLVRLVGPFKMAQDATIHTSSGLPVTSSGTASATLEGNLPKPPASRISGAKARQISGAPLSASFSWKFSSSLEGDPPDDTGRSGGALVVAALVAGIAITWFIRRRRKSAK